MSNDQPTHEEQIEKLAAMIKDIDFSMLTTALPDGTLRSRPMSTQNKNFNGTLWFFTRADSGKVHEIQDDQHVNIAYADTGNQTYISVSGKARLNRDRDKIEELWSEPLKAWFPDGKDDPELALLEIKVDSAEYWDSSSSAMVHLIGFVKATVTGKSYQPGENEKIDL